MTFQNNFNVFVFSLRLFFFKFSLSTVIAVVLVAICELEIAKDKWQWKYLMKMDEAKAAEYQFDSWNHIDGIFNNQKMPLLFRFIIIFVAKHHVNVMNDIF